MCMNTRYKFRYIYVIIILFVLFSLFYFLLVERYIKISERNFLNGIKQEVLLFMKMEKNDIFELAKSFAAQRDVVSILKQKEYTKFYKKNIFKIPKQYLMFKDIKIHIIDDKMRNRYLSWTKKGLGESLSSVRSDLKLLYENPHPNSTVSVGKYDITFKGTMPVYDKQNKFLGIVEVLKNFNYISKRLLRNKIKSMVVIDKRFKHQLKYFYPKRYINDYPISVSTLDKNLYSYINKIGIHKLVSLKTYTYIPNRENFTDGYYLFVLPINVNSEKKPIGYMLLFVFDSNHLVLNEIILHIVYVIVTLLFIFLVYFNFKERKKNIRLIENLNSMVKKEVENRLFLTYRDPLTNAYKLIKFSDDLKANKDKKAIMLNIRNFSKINEAFGFEAGDYILKICVKRLKNLLGRDIYRINADEFIIFSTSVKKDIKMINKKFINDPIKITPMNTNINITFSYGVTKCSNDKIISKLTLATKEAKKYPFSLFLYYRDKFHKRYANFIHINNIIYDALFRQNDADIVPFFQGIYDNKKEKITRYESLVRLHYKDIYYTPYHFLDIVKRSGFMYKMTEIVVEKSFKYIEKFNEKVSLSINITEDDLNTKKIKLLLQELTKKYAIEPKQVTLEILEGVTTIGTKNNIKQLKEIKKMGFRIALDDFGVEYSNFERISEIDIDFIKIDGKYIKDLQANPKSYQIVKAITNFAHNLDIKVVAEFVENEEIYKKVKELGIDYSQGYFFSKPGKEI